MSHQPGAYLGGVRCLETLRERCFVDSDTGCWHWRLAKADGTPRVWVCVGDGERRHMLGRRAALFLSTGKPLPSGKFAFAKPRCSSRDCVNPGHCSIGTRKEVMRAAVARGEFDTEARRLQVEAALRGKRKLSPEQHREIACSEVPTPDLAKSLGVSNGRINAIKRGEFGGITTSAFNFHP
jgi:hypothetical protein